MNYTCKTAINNTNKANLGKKNRYILNDAYKNCNKKQGTSY